MRQSVGGWGVGVFPQDRDLWLNERDKSIQHWTKNMNCCCQRLLVFIIFIFIFYWQWTWEQDSSSLEFKSEKQKVNPDWLFSLPLNKVHIYTRQKQSHVSFSHFRSLSVTRSSEKVKKRLILWEQGRTMFVVQLILCSVPSCSLEQIRRLRTEPKACEFSPQ